MTIADLIRQLEIEQFELVSGSDDYQRGWRAGWNAGRKSLLEMLREARTLAGLAELAEVSP